MAAEIQEKASGPIAQPVATLLTQAAIFLVVTINPGEDNTAAVRDFCAEFSALARAVEFRDINARFCAVMGVGSDAWERLFGAPRPAELHPFREFRAGARAAIATPGDLLFHIRSERMDLCFEMAMQIVAKLGGAVSVADETQGFRYFDDRDLLGFVDGTENPRGREMVEAALIGDEDPAFEGGSYVIVQKYLHNLDTWNALPTEAQERIVGRQKLSDVELDDKVKPSNAHNALTVISENGEEKAILRANMPFGNPGSKEFGTYFIGYCRTPRVTEQMIENMFVGRPPGNYDRLLDFSQPATGTLFFVPTIDFLDAVGEESPPPPSSSPPAPAQDNKGSLGIGSLKGDASYE